MLSKMCEHSDEYSDECSDEYSDEYSMDLTLFSGTMRNHDQYGDENMDTVTNTVIPYAHRANAQMHSAT